MKIVESRIRNYVKFEKLNVGDVFQTLEFNGIKTEYFGDGIGYGANAVDLYSGKFRYVSPEDVVILRDCELVLK